MLQDTDRRLSEAHCWGYLLCGGTSPCTPGFVGSKGAFRKRLCPACVRDGLCIDPSRVRVLDEAERAAFANDPCHGMWTSLPLGCALRVVNQTARCTGSPLLIFRDAHAASTTCDGVRAVPAEWLDRSGLLHLTVSNNTLVPSRPHDRSATNSMLVACTPLSLSTAGGDTIINSGGASLSLSSPSRHPELVPLPRRESVVASFSHVPHARLSSSHGRIAKRARHEHGGMSDCAPVAGFDMGGPVAVAVPLENKSTHSGQVVHPIGFKEEVEDTAKRAAGSAAVTVKVCDPVVFDAASALGSTRAEVTPPSSFEHNGTDDTTLVAINYGRYTSAAVSSSVARSQLVAGAMQAPGGMSLNPPGQEPYTSRQDDESADAQTSPASNLLALATAHAQLTTLLEYTLALAGASDDPSMEPYLECLRGVVGPVSEASGDLQRAINSRATPTRGHQPSTASTSALWRFARLQVQVPETDAIPPPGSSTHAEWLAWAVDAAW